MRGAVHVLHVLPLRVGTGPRSLFIGVPMDTTALCLPVIITFCHGVTAFGAVRPFPNLCPTDL